MNDDPTLSDDLTLLKRYTGVLTAGQGTRQDGNILAALPVTNGIVAYYPLNGDANDGSGNGYHGVVHGASPAADRHGVAGGACHLEGESYITLDHRAFDGLGDFTFAVWVRLDHLQETGTYAQNSMLSLANQQSDNEFLLHRGLVSPSGNMTPNIAANVCGKTGKNWCRFPGSGLSTGTWQHVVFVREGDEATLYQQGERIGSRPTVGTELRVDEGGAILGQEQDDVGGGFESHESLQGSLDDLAVFNRALSAEEVRQLFRMKLYNVGEHGKDGGSPFTKPSRVLNINVIVVLAGFRRKGIGELLMKRVQDLAEEEKLSRIDLNHWAGNESASRFFEKMGFKPLRHFLYAELDAPLGKP